ncbi:MAG TPA: DUF3306 domain-containing protein [Burkholderiales bacterium]|nr:DUF3306 domain-containing protein [Burkholderiales bacterium]
MKDEARQQPPEPVATTADPEAPAPPLPVVEDLTPDSDFRAFFHPKVGEDVRRAALKKLFSDPRFNVMDGLDVYIDDYSKSEPIPAAMLAGLAQAQKILGWAKEDEEKREQEKLSQAAPTPALEPPASQSMPAPARAPDTVSAPPDSEDGPPKT